MAYDVVTFVSAARGLAALRHVLSYLPPGFGAPLVCLVQAEPRTLEELRSVTRLRVEWAEAGVPLERGTVYLAPPNAALVWRPDKTLSITPVSLDSTAHNPVDHFLSSTAAVHGASAACLVLAGLDGDGVKGAADLKESGGTMLVLDRATAQFWGLAEPIVRAGAFSRVLTVVEAADALRACFTSRDLLRCAEIQIELGATLETALALSGTRMGHITRRTPGAEVLRVVVHRGLGAHFLERFDLIPVSNETATGRAALNRSRVVVPDVMTESSYEPHRSDAQLLGIRAVHATPIPASGRRDVQGVLTTLFVQPHTVTPPEARDMDVLADEASRLVARLA
ncbi:MAG TPA: chemotaxis protein CheB [Usitatibacter sp.]|nr:chemotaxis protein CheB [Usitatibacter sp.]